MIIGIGAPGRAASGFASLRFFQGERGGALKRTKPFASLALEIAKSVRPFSY